MMFTNNLIIGAGPAGLQLGYFLQRRGAPYLILDRESAPGGFFAEFPRHRRLLSINKVYTGCADAPSRLRYDWNSLLGDDDLVLPRYTEEYFPTPDVLLRYLDDYAQRYALRIQFDTAVQEVRRAANGFRVTTGDGDFECSRLFVGTGLYTQRLPDIPGVELCDRYVDCPVAPEAYRDQRVLIVGKGNSAFETADSMIATTRKIQICGPKTVKLAWGSHYVGDIRAVNNNFLDTYQLKAQNNILDGELRAVRRGDGDPLVAEVYFASRGRTYHFPCDRVILCTGFQFNGDMFADGCQPAMTHGGKLPDQTCEWESSNIPNMFFIGTLMQSRDYRSTMSAFIHGFRHNIEALDQMLEQRDGATWRWRRARSLEADVDAVVDAVAERLSTSPEIFLQPGYLCDVMALSEAGPDPIQYLEAVAVDYARERWLDEMDVAYVITLEYKPLEGVHDPFAMPRGVGVDEDFYLHPIIRKYERGALVGRFVLPDDLDNDWRNDPSNLHALRRYFAGELSAWSHSTRVEVDSVAEL